MSPGSGEATGSGNAGKWFLCLIAVSFMAMGLLFGWLMLRSYRKAAATEHWEQTEAVVLRCAIDQRQVKGSQPEYRLSILYGYEFRGESHTSDRLTPRGAKWTKSEESVARLAGEYAEQSAHTAWVNPDDPDEAILEHDTKAAGYTLWFPALFIVAGAGMIWGAFRGRVQPG